MRGPMGWGRRLAGAAQAQAGVSGPQDETLPSTRGSRDPGPKGWGFDKLQRASLRGLQLCLSLREPRSLTLRGPGTPSPTASRRVAPTQATITPFTDGNTKAKAAQTKPMPAYSCPCPVGHPPRPGCWAWEVSSLPWAPAITACTSSVQEGKQRPVGADTQPACHGVGSQADRMGTDGCLFSWDRVGPPPSPVCAPFIKSQKTCLCWKTKGLPGFTAGDSPS